MGRPRMKQLATFLGSVHRKDILQCLPIFRCPHFAKPGIGCRMQSIPHFCVHNEKKQLLVFFFMFFPPNKVEGGSWEADTLTPESFAASPFWQE